MQLFGIVFFCFVYFFLFVCFVVCVCDRVVDETEVGLSVLLVVRVDVGAPECSVVLQW